MEKITNKLSKYANFYTMLISIFVFFIFIFIVLPNEQARSFENTQVNISPDTNFFYTVDELYDIALRYGEQGRQYYIQSRFTFDIVWPLAYTSFLVMPSLYVFKHRSKKKQKLVYFSLFALIFDFLENIFVSIVMARYPNLTPGVAHLAPVFTMLKWITLSVAFVVLFYALFLYLFGVINGFVKRKK
jgi:hypothetical protein